MTEPSQTLIERYRDTLADLLPPGSALATLLSPLVGILEAIAVEYARVDDRGTDLRREAVPPLATELLPDWERILGLDGTGMSIEDRRIAIDAKLGSTLGIREADYVELAARVGYEVTVSYFRPFQPGISCAGDLVCTDEYQFVWLVTTSSHGEANDELLQSTLTSYAPPHTLVMFTFSDAYPLGELPLELG